MPPTVLLRIPAAGQANAEWLTVDAGSGAPTGETRHGPLALAAAAAKEAKVVVLAPATQVLLAAPELPPGGSAKLARAVPFALEEQLTEDIDQLFFAVGGRNARGATPVAVVARATMQEWLAQLASAGIEPAAIHADISLLPDNPGQTVLWLEGGRLAVRRPDAVPFAIEVAPISDALAIAGVIADPDSADPASKVPESAILYVTPDDWGRIQEEFEGLIGKFEALRIQLLPDGALPLLARALHTGDAVNLLQGEFARTAQYGSRWREWRVAAFLALGLLGAHITAQSIAIHRARQQTAELDRQIARIFASAMPGAALEDPRRQMQSQLALIRRTGAGPQLFLHMMQAISRAVAGVRIAGIDALSFHEQTLDMKVTAAQVDLLSGFSKELAQQGFTTAIQSSTPVPAGVEAHLQIRAAAALRP